MENKKPIKGIDSTNDVKNAESISSEKPDTACIDKKDIKKTDSANISTNKEQASTDSKDSPPIPKKALKPPKIEDKPFDEFIKEHLIPGLKSAIENKGTLVSNIKLIEGKRPVVGGNCWMILCELSEQRRFWLCFNKELITSDKTILLAESNSDPSIVESFLIDEKKTTLALLISRVLQRLNGQKWIGAN